MEFLDIPGDVLGLEPDGFSLGCEMCGDVRSSGGEAILKSRDQRIHDLR